eukprot:gene7887-12355_t
MSQKSTNTLTNSSNSAKQIINLEKLPTHGVMFLDLKPKKEEETEDFLIYNYPKKNIKLERIKGVLITINGVVIDIYQESPNIVTLNENETLVASYTYLSEFLLLVLILPNDYKTSKLYHQSISNQLNIFFHMLYENPENFIGDEKNHKEIDVIFQHFFTKYFESDSNLNVFLSSLNNGSVPYFQSSFDLSSKISEQLNLFEGSMNLQSNIELERPFVIKGSCLFHKSVLIGTHLNIELTTKIFTFSHIFNMLETKKDNPQNLIIEKIYTQQAGSEKKKEKILVLLSTGETLFCSVLEKIRDFKEHPNPYYVNEMKKVMKNITSSSIYSLLEKEMHPKEVENKMKSCSNSLQNYLIYSKSNNFILFPYGLKTVKFEILKKKFVEYCQIIHEFFCLNQEVHEHGIHLSHDDLNYYIIGKRDLIEKSEIFVAYHENIPFDLVETIFKLDVGVMIE